MSTTLVASKVVTPDGVHTPGWVRYEGESITGVGAGRPDLADGLSVDNAKYGHQVDRAVKPPRADANSGHRSASATGSDARSGDEIRDLGDAIIVPGGRPGASSGTNGVRFRGIGTRRAEWRRILGAFSLDIKILCASSLNLGKK